MRVFRIAQKIKSAHCINIAKESGLVYCTGCRIIIGMYDSVEESEAITLFNVREVLFRPHTSYTHYFATTGRNSQQVIYTEMVEHGEKCFMDALDIANVFVFPLVDLSVEDVVDVNQPSTSSNSVNPVIRVAAFASESSMNLDENCITKHFKDAIMSELNKPLENLSSSKENEGECAAKVSTPVWCKAPNLNENGTAVREHQSSIRSMDIELNEFLMLKDVDGKHIDSPEFDLDFFDD